MKTMHLLLGSTDRRLNNLIQATVLDVCYNRAAVECTRVARLGDFVRQGCCGSFDLMILVPDHLLAEPGQREINFEGLLQAVWGVRNQSFVPLLVLELPAEMEYRVAEAGADAVLQRPFKAEALRAELERVLSLPEPVAVEKPRGWSLASLFGFTV